MLHPVDEFHPGHPDKWSPLTWPPVVNCPITYADPTGYLPECVLPCAPCAACLIDLLIVCPPGEGWAECFWSVWQNLPEWTKLLCEITCEGCLECVGRLVAPPVESLQPALPRPCKPNCTAYVIAKQAACKVPISCKPSDLCPALKAKLAAGACYAAKKAVDQCSGYNWSGKNHSGSWDETVRAARNCQNLLIKKKCWRWGKH